MQINELRDALALRGATSGAEAEMIEFIKEQISAYIDELRVDALGNLICHVKGIGRKIAFYTGVDMEGIFIHKVSPDGSVFFNIIGDWPAKKYLGKNIRFTNGAVRTVSFFPPAAGEKKDVRNALDLYIADDDTLRDVHEDQIAVGDAAVLCEDLIYQDDSYKAWYNHVYAGIISMILAVQRCRNIKCDAYFVFSAFSKHGQGSIVALRQIKPDIAVSVTGIDGVCGGGPVIPYATPEIIYQRKRIRNLISIAKQEGISCQPIVMLPTEQDPWSSAMLSLEKFMRGFGIGTASLGIPIRKDENDMVICRNDDIAAVADLIASIISHCEML